MTKKSSLPSTWSQSPDVWFSLGLTAAAAIIHASFMNAYLATHNSFLLYTISRRGVDSTLYDPATIASIGTVLVSISAAVTLGVVLLTVFRLKVWIRIVILLQTLFIGVVVSNLIGSIVEYYVNNQLISGLVAGAICILAAITAVLFDKKYNPQPKKTKES